MISAALPKFNLQDAAERFAFADDLRSECLLEVEAMSAKGLRTCQEIVEASLQLFSVKGYYNTSISDILQATGLTKGGALRSPRKQGGYLGCGLLAFRSDLARDRIRGSSGDLEPRRAGQARLGKRPSQLHRRRGIPG
ncbi:TetR family transcriptional regulator [Desulforhabdus sp. TSK]|uniref:TetR family transcriptional regulator n=1 Tax=Desulforhabdus sp. TSK TaxID=2925014 RepID=UPI0034D3A33D